jgi:hypothetical protein
MPDFRDGNRLTTFNSGSYINHATFLNEFQDQVAAAFETRWVNLQFLLETRAPFNVNPPGIYGNATCLSATGTGAGPGDLFLAEQQGTQWMSVAAGITRARVKVEGTGTAIAIGLLIEDAKFSAPTTAPAVTATHNIYTGAMPGAVTYAVQTSADWSGAPKAITEDSRISLRIHVPAGDSGNTVILHGAQIKILVPKA